MRATNKKPESLHQPDAVLTWVARLLTSRGMNINVYVNLGTGVAQVVDDEASPPYHEKASHDEFIAEAARLLRLYLPEETLPPKKSPNAQKRDAARLLRLQMKSAAVAPPPAPEPLQKAVQRTLTPFERVREMDR